MARKLTARQKLMLRKLYEAHEITYIEDAPKEVQDELKRLNDYETVWHDANRYLIDLHFEKLYGS